MQKPCQLPDTPLARAAAALVEARSVLVLTGAGISVESGLPAYRGPGGVYEENPALPDLISAEGLERDPEAVWAYIDKFRIRAAAALPGPAHHILARWERENRFPGFLIATQNIDGLHQAAGSDRVSELHGSLWRMARPRTADYASDPAFSRDAEDMLAGRNREEILRRWSIENHRGVWEDRTVPFVQIPPYPDPEIRPDILFFGEFYENRLLWVEDFIKGKPDVVLIVGCSGAVVILDRLLRMCVEANPEAVLINVNAHEDPVNQPHLHLGMPATVALTALDGLLGPLDD